MIENKIGSPPTIFSGFENLHGYSKITSMNPSFFEANYLSTKTGPANFEFKILPQRINLIDCRISESNRDLDRLGIKLSEPIL